MSDIKRFQVGPRMSQGVAAGGLLHISGQVATDKSAGVEGQTRQVLGKLADIMAEAGAQKAGLVSVTVYLAHISDFAAMNAVYDLWIDPAHPPARACVEARLANPAIRVEISAVCAVSQ